MTINIPIPPLAFNAGGGCGDPNCDYQVQCDMCWQASRAQLAAFWARRGCRNPVMIGLYDESAMREADHQEALDKFGYGLVGSGYDERGEQVPGTSPSKHHQSQRMSDKRPKPPAKPSNPKPRPSTQSPKPTTPRRPR